MSTRQKIVTTCVAAAIVSTGAFASDMYGSLGAAMTSVDGGWDSGISIVATGGIKLDSVVKGFAVEAEASQTLSHPSESFNSYYYNYDLELSILNIGAYAAYNFPIPNTEITVKPRIGINYQDWTLEGSSYGYSASATDSDIALSFGLGASLALSDSLGIYVDYTDKGDSTNLGAGVQMAF